MEDKSLEDITPENIEGILIESIEKGHTEFAGMKEGEITVSLTGQGEERVQKLLGGKDVAEVSHTLYNLLVKHGALGFTVEPNFINFTIIAQLMSIAKHYKNWGAIVEATKAEESWPNHSYY